jgi:quercetin dioxygenase-like cupin family protein
MPTRRTSISSWDDRRVLAPGDTFTSPRGTVVEILENGPERFRLRRTLAPSTGRTPPHRHLNGVERFEIAEGAAVAALDGRRHLLRAGEHIVVPIGVSHVHPHTAAGGTATVIHTIEPRPRFVEVFFASWLGWLQEGNVDRQDEPKLLGVMAVIREGGGGTWVTGPPIALQKGLAEVLGRVAALRGLKATT